MCVGRNEKLFFNKQDFLFYTCEPSTTRVIFDHFDFEKYINDKP